MRKKHHQGNEARSLQQPQHPGLSLGFDTLIQLHQAQMPGLRQFRPGPKPKPPPAVFKIYLNNRQTLEPLYTIDMSEVYGIPVILTTTKGDLREILGGCKQHTRNLTPTQISQEIDFTRLQCQVWLHHPDISNKCWTLRVYVASLTLLALIWLSTGKKISGQAVHGNQTADMFADSALLIYSTSNQVVPKATSQPEDAKALKPPHNRKPKGGKPNNNLAGRRTTMDDSAANSRRVSSMSGQGDVPAINDSTVSPTVSMDHRTALEIAALQGLAPGRVSDMSGHDQVPLIGVSALGGSSAVSEDHAAKLEVTILQNLTSESQQPLMTVDAAPQVASTLSPQQSMVQLESVTQQGIIAVSQQPRSLVSNAAPQIASTLAAQQSMMQVQDAAQQVSTVASQQPPSTALNAVPQDSPTAILPTNRMPILIATQQGSTDSPQQLSAAGQDAIVIQEDSTDASQQDIMATDAVTQGLSTAMTHQRMTVTDVVAREDTSRHMQPVGEVQPVVEVRAQGPDNQTSLQHPIQTQVQAPSGPWLLRIIRSNKEEIKMLIEVALLILEARKLIANPGNARQADRSTNAPQRSRGAANGRSRSRFVRVICMLMDYYRSLMDPNQGMMCAMLKSVVLTLIKEVYKKAQEHISQQVA